MSEQTRVLVVRHGETEWNREGRIQGHLDSPLTRRGVEQAEAVAMRLRTVKIDAIYSSDLGRAFTTAEIISGANGCGVAAEPRLRERDLGIFQGLNETEIEERYPREWGRFLSRDPEYRMPHGESARDRVDRTNDVLSELGNRHDGDTILFVTHGGILDAIFRLVVGLPLDAPRQFKIWNAGINLISRSARPSAGDTGRLGSGGPASPTGGGWMIELWGDTGAILQDQVLDDT